MPKADHNGFFTAALKSVDSDWMPGIHSIFGTEPCNDVMAHSSMFEVEVLLAIVVFLSSPKCHYPKVEGSESTKLNCSSTA